MHRVDRIDWYGLHAEGWNNDLVPEAFSHPAKVRPALARRIYEHLLERGYVEPGAVVVDPFAGIGGFALHAMRNGLNWVGIELEEKFVGLCQQNLDLWNKRFSRLPHWGTARVVQGDSRELAALLAGAGGLVSSPPWESSDMRKGGSDLLYQVRVQTGRNPNAPGTISHLGKEPYGNSPGQLAALPPGDLAAALVAGRSGQSHGTSDGQLAAMPVGRAIVSSPPYEGSEGSPSLGSVNKDDWGNDGHDIVARRGLSANYGETVGQIGHTTGDTFWSAARTIMEECHKVLAPGAVAVWVLKAFVRDKAIVDFPGQWQRLGESCGFETIEIIRAHLVEDRGMQFDLWGDAERREVKRVSFFRRLYEKNYPENSIDHEVVLIQRRLPYNL